ncbi:hypothetical protein [Parahaliea mediterranea]|uniref:hypothetical protein n=1 Tax=Parahaliea mediterranea TaxID=651086 RepID=UPI0013007E1B|nr:hypothetical protein [Parahaliea mediterranea]
MEEDEILEGATCKACGEKVEINAAIAISLPVILVLSSISSFRLGQTALGIAIVIASVVYASMCERINSKVLPLKVYK